MWIIIPRNNIVSLVKQYCFTCQTQVFHFPNNIVSSVKVNYSEDEILVLGFGDNNLMIFTSSLYEKAHFCELLFCTPYTVCSCSFARDSDGCPTFGSSVSLICSNVCLAKRLRMPFPVTNSYFGARKALLRRFVWHFDKMTRGHFRTITLPLAWCVASISTSAICTCSGALEA